MCLIIQNYFLWLNVYFARGDPFARGHFCTRLFCTSVTLAWGDLFYGVTFSRMDNFVRQIFCTSDFLARRVTFARFESFARRLFWTEGHLCTASIWHGKIFARLQLLHDVAFVLRDFCKASLLHGVITLRKYLFTTKFLKPVNFERRLVLQACI